MNTETNFRKLFNKPLPPKKEKQLGVRLTEAEQTELNEFCRKNKFSKSLFVRESIVYFMKTKIKENI